jgi:excinuclease ABC subunit B
VASVSCIYGLGSPEEYEKVNLKLELGMKMDRTILMKNLIQIHFERTNADLTSGTFRSIGTKVEFMPVSDTIMYQIEMESSVISKITKVDPISSQILKDEKNVFIFPAKHFITEDSKKKKALVEIKKELDLQLKKFKKKGKLLEAERIKRRTNYDLAMIKEIGYCNGIENYSRYLSGKNAGDPPETLLSYFPHIKNQEHTRRRSHTILEGQDLSGRSEYSSECVPDFLTIIDESHVTLPQLNGMYAGDASRKNTLVEYGFRLPSAKDNRPLKYDEFSERIGSVVYVSATPSEIERTTSEQIVEQIIRPTGLIDPETIVRPVSADGKSYGGQIQDFIMETEKTIKKGFRVLATTLTKKMAEDLSVYLKDKKIKSEYLHSDIKTMERIKILTEFRKGTFDVLVGVNLLREGLDLPEVALIGILDADKEGFLRSETSLIQTIGRAARNSEGRVLLYADVVTGSMERALKETIRRRNIQIAYNKKYNITPKTILKKIKDITEELESAHGKIVNEELRLDLEVFEKAYLKDKNKAYVPGPIGTVRLSDEERKEKVYDKIIKLKEKEMNKAVKELDFETAAILRDEIGVLKTRLEKQKFT